MTGENSPEARLRDKLRKIEALFAGAGTAGEKAAAGAAADRIRALLGNAAGSEAPEEIRCSDPRHLVPTALYRALSSVRDRSLSISPDAHANSHRKNATQLFR